MPTWEIQIGRLSEQTRGSKTRTVGTYQVLHDGQPAAPIAVDGVAAPLSGTMAESKGPSQNAKSATPANPSRILPGRYPLKTSGGPTYVTNGYRNDLKIEAQMPGIELLNTGNRTAILIHPGKNEFLSSIGCVNLCTSLSDAAVNIDYPGSRRRVIALIEDMKRFLGNVPGGGDRPIPNAFAVIDETALQPGQGVAAAAAAAANGDGTIDGNKVAALFGVAVKPSARISKLDPAMEPVIEAVAEAAKSLGLPQPVITSGNDGRHMAGSLHFKGRALDFRGNNISNAAGAKLKSAVQGKVGGDYDVLFEIFPGNPANDHLHVEFQSA